jgi:hypothetical protein
LRRWEDRPHVKLWSFFTSTPTVDENLIAFDRAFTGDVFVG